MTWSFTRDLDTFTHAAEAFLTASPGVHTVPLTVLSSLRSRGLDRFGPKPPLFGWWDGGGTVVWTPPFFVGVTALPPDAVEALALEARTWDVRPDGATGPRDTVRALAAAYSGTPQAPAPVQEKSLYRLGVLRAPDPAPDGRARTAVPADRPLMLAWCEEFLRETRPRPAEPGEAEAMFDDRMTHDGFTVWEDARGVVVSMAARSRPVAGMVRVGSVYTPPEARRRGYAAAVTAAVTTAALEEDGAADVVLFADKANADSNGVYRRLGYAVVDDHEDVPFIQPPSAPRT